MSHASGTFISGSLPYVCAPSKDWQAPTAYATAPCYWLVEFDTKTPIFPSYCQTLEACEVTEQLHVIQRIFRGRADQHDPLPHKVRAQQRLRRERRPSALAFRHEWRNHHHQVEPRYILVHLVKELPTAVRIVEVPNERLPAAWAKSSQAIRSTPSNIASS
jgi:hypothetical protein